MIVICACGAKLKISDEKLTVAGVKIKCPKCSSPHLVKKPADAAPALPAGGTSMPWFASSSPSSSKPLILIAHDSKVVAEMIEQVVTEAGYSSAHAPDGLEALKMALQNKPQVMIVDVGLTGIYGFELCERLKGDPETRSIKIILLSSVYGLTAYKRSPVTLYGADDYIEKHHIPDRLVSKIQRLLSGEPMEAPQAPPVPEQSPVLTDRTEQEKEDHRSTPLIRRRGIEVGPSQNEGAVKGTAVPAVPAAPEKERGPRIPEIPDVMPKVPITLDAGQKRMTAAAVTGAAAQPLASDAVRPKAATASHTVKAEPDSSKTITKQPALKDESVMLDASFFEPEEYAAPAGPVASSPVDPEEIEKARRFARLIVSDIALYNQDIVVEGLKKGTFFELLQDDINEGRSLYDNRVPDAIRASKDYYQEAFDDFIAAKKKQH